MESNSDMKPNETAIIEQDADVAPAESDLDKQGSDFSFVSNIRHPQKRAFLVDYSFTGSIVESTGNVGISRDTHYVWMMRDPEYAKAFQEADVIFGDVLEAAARKRALEKSDLLMIFTLKAQKPHKYRDNVDITSGGKPLEPPKIEVVYEVKADTRPNDT